MSDPKDCIVNSLTPPPDRTLYRSAVPAMFHPSTLVLKVNKPTAPVSGDFKFRSMQELKELIMLSYGARQALGVNMTDICFSTLCLETPLL
nr:hypothetical protein CFP56_30712 [Quercus suber]